MHRAHVELPSLQHALGLSPLIWLRASSCAEWTLGNAIHSASSRTKNVIGATLVGTTRRVPVELSWSMAGCGDRRPQPTAPVMQELVEFGRIVVDDALREDLSFPGAGGNFETLQLLDDFQCAAFAAKLRSRRNMLPAEEPSHESCGGDRFDLFTQ